MASIQNFSSRLVAAGFALLFFSCSENVETKEQEEVLKPVEEIAPVFTPFKIMVVRQAVSDFDK